MCVFVGCHLRLAHRPNHELLFCARKEPRGISKRGELNLVHVPGIYAPVGAKEEGTGKVVQFDDITTVTEV